MERQFPAEFPFAGNDPEAAAPEIEVARLETPPPPWIGDVEVIDSLTEADLVDVPEAEEIFELPEEAAAPQPVVAEAALASPVYAWAVRELVTPVMAPLGAVAAVPAIVEAAVPEETAFDAAEPVLAASIRERADRGPERRKTPRQAIRAKASFRGEADVTAQRTVRIVNLSLKGVRFWSGQAMAKGDRGDVRMEAGPVKWASRVRVVSCARQDEGYEVGCEFVTNELTPRRANLVNPLVWAPVKGGKPVEAKAVAA